MTQTYRTDDFARWGAGQGFNLTAAQVDINFWDLVQRMIAQEARPDPSAGIDHFEIVGINMFVHMTDATVLGPYELPVATFQDRGVWAPETVYSKMDTFTINGGLYVVTFDHTSDLTFDAGANDGAGHDYYQLMIQTPGASLPSGGVVGHLLKKTTTTDYAVGWGYTDASVVDFEPATGSTLTSFNVADALEELAAGSFSGDAADVSYDPSTASGLTSTNVQDALDELGASGGGGDAVDVVYDPTASGLTATDVQAAIDELASSGGGAVGRQTVWIPATGMIPRTTNGAAAGSFEMSTNKSMVKTLDFDTSTQEFAQFHIVLPKSWNFGHVFYQVFWSHPSTTTNFGVAFGMEARGPGDGDYLDSNFGSTVVVTDTGGTEDHLYVTAEGELTIVSGTYPAMILFQLHRDPANGSDNLAVDARVHGVMIMYVTSAATDD